jgi:uncharacterized membrane protein HdeD (DUF308 family)
MKINIANPQRQIIFKATILILFWLTLFVFPQYSINSILLILWIFLIVIWLFSIFTSIKRKTNKTINRLIIRQWIFDILIWSLIALYPQQTTELLVIIIGLRILLIGGIQFLQEFSYINKKKIKFFYAIIWLAIGILIITNPRESTITLTYMIGSSSIILGIALIIFSTKIKKLFKNSHQLIKVEFIEWEEVK